MRLALHLGFFRRRVVCHTYAGFPLRVLLADGMGQDYYDRDQAEPSRITVLKSRSLRPGATVFDLGAHYGVRALVQARIVGPSGCVVAVEANSHNAAVAEANRKLNGAAHVKVIHGAVAAADGLLAFSRDLNGQVKGGLRGCTCERVPALSVDSLATRFGVPDVMLIDVEGYECEVLQGAGRVLQARPDVFLEVHVNCGLELFNGSVEKLLGFFPSSDYELLVSRPHLEFHPLAEAAEVMEDYFFLLALSRQRTPTIAFAQGGGSPVNVSAN